MGDTYEQALVLLGHGTALNPESGTAVFRQAEALRVKGMFGEVQAAFWKQEPRVNDVLASVRSRKVFIVPMFISEGFFCSEVIPRELGFPKPGSLSQGVRTFVRDGQEFFYTEPVGTHPSMVRIVGERAAEVIKQFPFPRQPKPAETTLLVAGHGTPRNKNSRESVEKVAEAMTAQRQYAAVHAVFMEEPPLISDWKQLTQTRNAVVVPFFISDGLHAVEDIPVLLGESKERVAQRVSGGMPPWRNPTEKQSVLVWYASSVGTSALVQEIILDRARQAGAVAG